jgi:hypothetical protein
MADVKPLPFSLMAASVGQRALLALLALVPLWVAVYWATLIP